MVRIMNNHGYKIKVNDRNCMTLCYQNNALVNLQLSKIHSVVYVKLGSVVKIEKFTTY